MQQQALVAQSAYLSPVATVAAVQMQQLAALNPSIIATPIASITPSSGNERQSCQALAGLDSISAWTEERHARSSWTKRKNIFILVFMFKVEDNLKQWVRLPTSSQHMDSLKMMSYFHIYTLDLILKSCKINTFHATLFLWQHNIKRNIYALSISTFICHK